PPSAAPLSDSRAPRALPSFPTRRSSDLAPPAASAEPSVDVIPILVSRKVLTAEQAERVRRATRMSPQSGEQAVIQLGFASEVQIDRKSTRLNSSHVAISYAVFCLKKKKR